MLYIIFAISTRVAHYCVVGNFCFPATISIHAVHEPPFTTNYEEIIFSISLEANASESLENI